MFRLIVLLMAGVTLAVSDVYPSCDGITPTGTLTNVIVTGCSPGVRCNTHRGSAIPFEVDFIPSRDSSTLTVKVYGQLPGVPIALPFIGFDTVGCNPAYGIQCPLRAFTPYKYNSTVHVPTAVVTPLNVQAKMQLKDDGGDTIACYLIDLRITS